MTGHLRRILLALGLACVGFSALAQGFLFESWMLFSSGCNATAGLPGDLVPSAIDFWGLRAYNTAAKGSRAINVCNVGDVVCADMHTDATTGDLVVTTIGGSDCSVVVCTIKRIWDQVGPANIGNDVIATRATLKTNCIGSKACFQCNGSQDETYVGDGVVPPQAQPFTYSWMAKNTGTSGGAANHGVGAGALAVGYTSTSVMYWTANNTVSPPYSNVTFNAVQNVFNGAAGVSNIDGTILTAQNIGTGDAPFGTFFHLCRDAKDNLYLTGAMTEFSWWAGALSNAQLITLNCNQHTYWGF